MTRVVSRFVRCLGTAVVFALLVAISAAPGAATELSRDTDLPIRSRPVVRQTPELDPALARSVATIIIGGVLILSDRRRR